MPRPRRRRRINFNPEVTYFKPAGIKKSELEQVTISLEELEALRLKNIENLDQDQAAKKMDVSQPTFHRMLLAARKKITDAIINGKALKIEK